MSKKKERDIEVKPDAVEKFRLFLNDDYGKELYKAAEEEKALVVNFNRLDRRFDELSQMLLEDPDQMLKVAKEAVDGIDLPTPVKIRFSSLPETGTVNVRDLRSKHIGNFIVVEGIVRRASEIRPEIVAVDWKCRECDNVTRHPVSGTFVSKPFRCGNIISGKSCDGKSFEEHDKVMIDARWVTIEEPFELTEGEKPSQVNVWLSEDLVSPDGRRMTDPGNRLKMVGVLREVPKGKMGSVKLDFYMDANHVEPTETTWERLKISPKEEEQIKEFSRDPMIFEKLVASMAPSLYGLEHIKESIILQLFGGVPRLLPDGTQFRGDIHILIIGDPSSGKSQLLKLVPSIVPRGRYVSGKGVTGAGLTATVTKDEQFMGGWVLEAGALVLTNKGLLSIDEFEKMNVDDQIAMHEALEQGSISIAKASIVATLPAKTSVLAGGNPKFSRFDPMRSISEQIDVPPTLLSRFDLKFTLRDVPEGKTDKKIVEHVLKSRHEEDTIQPAIEQEMVRKYVAYAKENYSPQMTPEVSKLLKNFYVKTRSRAEGGGPVPITLRQFEALMRLAEASAKIRLSNEITKDDANRAIRLMKSSLKDLGYDTETGEIDVDKSEGGTSFSERSKITRILNLIDQISGTSKDIVPVAKLRDMAAKEGIESGEVDDIVERLKREGVVFEPNPGYIQRP
ncbi:MAG: minichromosome maintenance protein MCM [Candidatus Aenigmatarchaeota archaeon]|nr:MAG: minichromosome maintenance protein MCM [Candidatus Aenigmarchaeota archaeon]